MSETKKTVANELPTTDATSKKAPSRKPTEKQLIAAAMKETDVTGTKFDPKKHRWATKESDGSEIIGKPATTPAGKFISRRGRKNYSNVDGVFNSFKTATGNHPAFCKEFVKQLKEKSLNFDLLRQKCVDALLDKRKSDMYAWGATQKPALAPDKVAEKVAGTIDKQWLKNLRLRLLKAKAKKMQMELSAVAEEREVALEQLAKKIDLPEVPGTGGSGAGRRNQAEDFIDDIL